MTVLLLMIILRSAARRARYHFAQDAAPMHCCIANALLGRGLFRVNPCRLQPALRYQILVRTSSDTCHAERRPCQWRSVPTSTGRVLISSTTSLTPPVLILEAKLKRDL